MAEYLQKILGGAKESAPSEVDADFADFATAASPIAPDHAATQVLSSAHPTGTDVAPTVYYSNTNRPYTKWYRVWERTSPADFYQEMFILPLIILLIAVNVWGSNANKRRAKKWSKAHLPILQNEFARVGFGNSTPEALEDFFLKERNKGEYLGYATGRQNIAGLDIKVTLYPRSNPFKWAGETLLSFFMESIPAPAEKLEASAYCFDGREKSLVPATSPGASVSAGGNSAYDGFVWAVVHKSYMKTLRDDRYDISLTSTKDNPKLPAWATVMSESAEVTDALLTPELIKAIEQAGETLEALIVTDMPIDAPRKLDDLVPRKRATLYTRFGTDATSVALFEAFLRIPDFLVANAHFRPEALRRIKQTRDEEVRKIKKRDEEAKAEERREATDKLKKEERERKLRSMTDAEQRKFLEKERQKDSKKANKARTMRA